MTITLKMKGMERKILVTAVAEITGEKAKYLGVPSVAYRVGNYIITKEGNIETGEAEEAEIFSLLERLSERGFSVDAQLKKIKLEEKTETAGKEAEQEERIEDCLEEEKEAEDEEESGTAIQIPMKNFSERCLNNLYALVEAKGHLIKRALDVEKLPINIRGDRLDFPWFKEECTPEELNAYMHFVTALCDMAKCQRRILAKPTEVDNEKYAFRCFLLRLGFIGEEFKEDRKILLRNLNGSAAFKHKI